MVDWKAERDRYARLTRAEQLAEQAARPPKKNGRCATATAPSTTSIAEPEAGLFIPDDEPADSERGPYLPATLPDEPVSTRYQVNPHIAERLQRKFGLGTDPDRRRRLYAKLAEEVERHPEAETVIGDVIQCSDGCDKNGKPITNPGNWFCRSVILRLREAGFLRPTVDW